MLRVRLPSGCPPVDQRSEAPSWHLNHYSSTGPPVVWNSYIRARKREQRGGEAVAASLLYRRRYASLICQGPHPSLPQLALTYLNILSSIKKIGATPLNRARAVCAAPPAPGAMTQRGQKTVAADGRARTEAIPVLAHTQTHTHSHASHASVGVRQAVSQSGGRGGGGGVPWGGQRVII